MGFIERTDEEISKAASRIPQGTDIEFEFISPTAWRETALQRQEQGTAKDKDHYILANHTTPDDLLRRLDEFDLGFVTGSPLEHNAMAQESDQHPDGLSYFDEIFATTLDTLYERKIPTMLVCLSAQVDFDRRHGVPRLVNENKLLDVFTVQVKIPADPVMKGLGSEFDIPAARYGMNDERFFDQAPNLQAIAHSDETGTAVAKSGSFYYITGHEEYEKDAIAQEFFRDLYKLETQRLLDVLDLDKDFLAASLTREEYEQRVEAVNGHFDQERPKIGTPTRYDVNNPRKTWDVHMYPNFVEMVFEQKYGAAVLNNAHEKTPTIVGMGS
jgi:hypothetical protein